MFVEISLEWLLGGRGEMLKTKSKENLTLDTRDSETKSKDFLTIEKGKENGKDSRENEKKTISYHSENKKENQETETRLQNFKLRTDFNIETQSVPLYNIDVSAGLVPLFKDTESYKPLDFITIPNLPKCDGAVYVTGDSMYPLLKSGDIVLYKKINDFLPNIFWGEMYLISIDLEGEEYVTVKYIQRSDIKDHIRLVSHNQHHSDKDVHVSKIRALAFVKASIRINSMK